VASLFPLNGSDGEGEWAGFIPFDQLPHVINPQSHFVATANNRPVGKDYPYYIGWNWWDRYRFDRIAELLSQGEGIDVGTFRKMQTDSLSADARVFVPFLVSAAERNHSHSDRTERAVVFLSNWDYRMRKEEVAATIYDEWLKHLLEHIWDKTYMKAGLNTLVGKYPPLEVTEHVVKENLTSWLRGDRDKVLINCLSRAVEDLRWEMGRDIDRWVWGKRNRCKIRHRFGRYIAFLNYPTISADGGRHTISPIHRFAPPMDYVGSAWRQIIDLANIDNSLCVLAGGQSGHRFNRNWRNQLRLWAYSRYKPMTLG
jgi:penicillin amidase